MSEWWGFVCGGVAYSAVALFAGILVYVVSNPYGHITPQRQWTQTLLAAALWPFWLVYVIGIAIYFSWFANE